MRSRARGPSSKDRFCLIARLDSDDPVASILAIGSLTEEREADAPFDGGRQKSSQAVRLPPGGLDHLGDTCAVRSV
jgi:hypothetical protein